MKHNSKHFVFLISFLLIFSCSNEEEDTEAPLIQTPQPEAETTVTTQYTLTVSAAEGGTVSNQGGTYDEGTQITVTADPSEGYIFNGWQGNNSPERTLIISLSSNIVLTANFRQTNTTDVINDPEVFNYDIYEDYNEQNVDFYPNAFFASDLSENVINGVNLGLKTAADEYGKYGPVEYYVFGTDRQAALELIDVFCKRREVSNQWPLSDCTASEQAGFLLEYQIIGEQSISVDGGPMMASHNGGSQWGIHYLGHSYPYNFDYFLEYNPPQDDFKTVLHEYFHVVQLASVYNEDSYYYNYPGDAIWLMEGGAEYMANYSLFKLINNGSLSFEWTPPPYPYSYVSLREKMREKMNNGKRDRQENCPEMRLDQFTYNDCTSPGYDLGAWAVAFLNNKVNNSYILIDTFYPNLKTLGFEGAFNKAFGYSTEEFYEEFDAFLELPIEEQLEIIPDI